MARAKDRTNLQCRLAYSLPEAAAVLGVSLTTMTRWVQTGVVPSAKIVKRRFVARATLDRLLQQRTTPDPAHEGAR